VKLLDLFVQFSQKGAEALKTEMKKVEAIAAEAGKGFDRAGAMGTKAFAAITAGVGGFVIAGFRGSVQMQAMEAQLGRLSRGIAALFVPEMNKLIDLVAKAATWFEHLTGSQQRMLAHLVEGVAIGALVTTVVGKLGSVIMGGLVPAISTVIGLLEVGNIALADIPQIIGLVVTGLTLLVGAFSGVAVATESGRSALAKIGATLAPIGEALGDLWGAAQEFLEPLGDLVGDVLDAFSTVVPDIVGQIKDVASAIKTGFAEIAPYIRIFGAAFKDGFAAISEALRSLNNDFGSFLPTMGDMIRVFAKTVEVALEGVVRMFALVRTALAAAKNPSLLGDPKALLAEYQKNLSDIHALGAKAPSKGDQGRSDVAIAPHGTEAITQTFSRLQSASLKVDYDRMTADNTKRAADGIDLANTLLGKLVGQPAADALFAH
jgi:phage-related protein